jgi:hypothetical protein
LLRIVLVCVLLRRSIEGLCGSGVKCEGGIRC